MMNRDLSYQKLPSYNVIRPTYLSLVLAVYLICLVVMGLAVLTQNATAQEASIFIGTCPPVASSKGTLTLNDDLQNKRTFQWQSTDSILGEIDTGSVTATTWNYLPGSPSRLVFAGNGGGAILYGNVLFEPYNRAVVDVVKGAKRIRYLLEKVVIELQWINHENKSVDLAALMTENAEEPYNRGPGQPGGVGGFGGPHPDTGFEFFQDPFRFENLVFNPPDPDGLSTITCQMISNVSDIPTNGVDNTNSFMMTQLTKESSSLVTSNEVLGLMIVNVPEEQVGLRKTFEALVFNPIFGLKGRLVFYETEAGTNVYMTRRLLLTATLSSLPDPDALETMEAILTSNIPGSNGDMTTGLLLLEETGPSTNEFESENGSFRVKLDRITDKGATGVDDFTASISCTLLDVYEEQVDAIESDSDTLEFRTDLIHNLPDGPIIEGEGLKAALARQYRVKVVKGKPAPESPAWVVIDSAPDSKNDIYKVGPDKVDHVFVYRTEKFKDKIAIFEFFEADKDNGKEKIELEAGKGAQITKVYAKLNSTITAEEKSGAKTTIRLTKSEFILLWKTVPVNAKKEWMEKEDAFPFKIFIDDPKGTDKDGAWIVEKKGDDDFQKTGDAEISKGTVYDDTIQGIQGKIYTGYFLAKKPGVYRVSFQYKDYPPLVPFPEKAPGGFELVTAVDALIASALQNASDQMFVGKEGDARYGIMPSRYFSDKNKTEPDAPGSDTWKLMGTTLSEKERRFVKGDGSHTLKFGDKEFVTLTKDGKTKIKIAAAEGQLEGEGDLKVSKTEGRFYIDGEAKAWVELGNNVKLTLPGADNANFLDADLIKVQRKDVSGTIEPFLFIMPNLDISKPDGDPEKEGDGGANEDNEAVFDDQKPQGEAEGQCLVKLEANKLEGLSDPSKQKVWKELIWSMEDIGSVKPAYKPEDKGGKVEVTYEKMPDKMSDFGPKRITMTLADKKYKYYQKIEFFFHYPGMGGRGANAKPNWFYYWEKMVPIRKGGGNGGNLTITPGTDPNDTGSWRFVPPGSEITINQSTSLAMFLGIARHEEKHETDFWVVMWRGGGYNPGRGTANDKDIDRDSLNDDWEEDRGDFAPGGAEGPKNPAPVPAYDFTQPQNGNTNELDRFRAWEDGRPNPNDKSWGDPRADEAAVNAINIDNELNAGDWSNLKVSPGKLTFGAKTAETKKGNNKNCCWYTLP